MPRPKGSKNDKRWTEALKLAVMREVEGRDGKTTTRLNYIADRLCEMAMDGEIQAIRLIEERLEGKAPVAIDHSSTDGTMSPPTVISLVAAKLPNDDSGD